MNQPIINRDLHRSKNDGRSNHKTNSEEWKVTNALASGNQRKVVTLFPSTKSTIPEETETSGTGSDYFRFKFIKIDDYDFDFQPSMYGCPESFFTKGSSILNWLYIVLII